MTIEKLKKVRKVFLVLAMGVVVFMGGYYAGSRGWWGLQQRPGLSLNFSQLGDGVRIDRWSGAEQRQVDFNLFWEVWDKLKEQYIDKTKLNESDMVYKAIKGMVSATGDPYTVFLTPDENKRAKDDLNGAFEGVGIQLGFKEINGDQRLAVISPLEGMPAIKVGVKAGDVILKIDDQNTTGMTLPDAVKLIRGEKGTVVKLTLMSEGAEVSHEVSITRGVITVPSVELKWITEKTVNSPSTSLRSSNQQSVNSLPAQAGNQETDKSKAETPVAVEKVPLDGAVAHLRVTRFGDQTSKEWNEAVRQILNYQQGPVKGIVLDLRGNPGGFFQGAIELGSDLVESGVIVQQEAADGTKEQFRANGSARLVKFPLVVLVNQGSASASEILAGAIRELRGAKIVGEKSFGKGSVQEAMDLEGNAGLHITTYRWLLPSGKWIDKVGIEPDVEVKQNQDNSDVDEQLNAAIDQL